MKMHSAPRQRKEALSVDKENAEQPNKMPIINVVARKTTSPLMPSFKLRKNSDNADEKLPRTKGLQVTSTNILNNLPRRRIQSSSDATAKAFMKTRFTVYDDGKSKSANLPTGKRSVLKLRETDKTKDIEKWVKSVNDARCVPSTLLVVEKQKDDKKSSDQGYVSSSTLEVERKEKSAVPKADSKKSPKNLPVIKNPDVCNIKERHNKRSTPRKTPKVAYEILSLELAYNIDYMTEYIRYQMEISEKKKLSSSFLKKGITVDQRRLIVRYLVDSTTYYKSPSYILYQAVKIFDVYIDKVNVKLYELQTVALAALWIALKKDLIIDDIPEAHTIMELAPTTFKGDSKPLLECEKKILMTLQFEINFADPFSMLALYAIMIEEIRELESSSIQELYYCGSYLMDLSMLDKDLCNVLAVHLAEICAEIALVIVMMNNENAKDSEWNHWRSRVLEANPILERYLLPESKMNYIRNLLLQKTVLSKDKESDYYSVYKKYCTKRYGTVAVFLTDKVSSLFVSKIIESGSSNRPIIF